MGASFVRMSYPKAWGCLNVSLEELAEIHGFKNKKFIAIITTIILQLTLCLLVQKTSTTNVGCWRVNVKYL